MFWAAPLPRIETGAHCEANYIDELVRKDAVLLQRLSQQDFLCDTVNSFQGDERDLILFSPVVAPGMPEGAMGFLRGTPNLFNVAITRARAALWVVGNFHAALTSGIDYLAAFARYATERNLVQPHESSPPLDLGPDYPPVRNPGQVSEWEHMLYRALYAAGLRPIPQYAEEQYTLDFALIAGDRKLNIEVDGERYHRNWDGELCRRDVIRNQRLIELGWSVKRFWVYQVRDRIEECVDQVRRWAVGS